MIVACSDSRVPPELIFDRGLGDLFIIRVAGNIVDEFSLGAIQYALQQVGTKLVVVMGHEKCGAIEAALDFDASKPEPAKPLRLLVEGLVPARTWARKEWGPSVGRPERCGGCERVPQYGEGETAGGANRRSGCGNRQKIHAGRPCGRSSAGRERNRLHYHRVMPPEISFETLPPPGRDAATDDRGDGGPGRPGKGMEDANEASYSAALALKSNQEQLFEAQKAQQEVNSLLKESLDKLLRAIGQQYAGPVTVG